MEYNDVYDARRNRTGRRHLRGTPWAAGEYGLVVCVWVHDGHGRLLLTLRAPEKLLGGTWENSGGSALAGESSLQAIRRELFEETGIRAEPEEFELLESLRERSSFYDFYCVKKQIPLEQIVLQPGETVDARWVTFAQMHRLIRENRVCPPVAERFLRHEQLLRRRQTPTFE